MLEKFHVPCAYNSLLGVDCPACGSQRAFDLLLQGEFFESFKMFPPLIPVLFLIVFFILHLLNSNWIGRKFMFTYAAIVLGITMVSYFVKLIL